VPDEELPASAAALPAALESVAGAEGAEPVELAAPVEAAGAEALLVLVELGSAAAVSAGVDAAGAVDVADPVGSETGGAVGAVVALPVVVGVEVPDGAVLALGSVVAGGVVEPVPPGVASGSVDPPVAADPGLAVWVEVAPPEVVGVVEVGPCGPPSVVELTVPGAGRAVAGGCSSGAGARGAERAGTEASSLSRVVGGAVAR
jgi:hypothetical protein